MIKPIAAIVCLGLLAGCTHANNILDTGFAVAGKVKQEGLEKAIEGTRIGAKNYCRIEQEDRLKIREDFADRADADPETRGLRVQVTCPKDTTQPE